MEKNPHFSSLHSIFLSTLEKPVRIVHGTINKKHILASIMKLVAMLQSRIRLLFLGTISELVYFFYFLHAFPLTHYFHDLTNMGKITSYSHTSFFIFIIAFSFLFVIFGLAWWEAHRFQDHATLWIILSFSAFFIATNIFLYPFTSTDLFTYFVRGLVMVQHSANPMIIPPAHFPQDPLMKLAGYWVGLPSPYGPLGILIQDLPVLIAGRNILVSLLLFKIMFSIILIVESFFIYKILSYTAPRFALSGTLALAWNPFALLEYSANSHNDIVMMFFVILAVFALVRKHHLWAMALITTSVLIKFASLVIIPLFFIYSFIQQPTKKARIIYTLKASIVFLSIMIDSFAFFWAGPQTLQRFFNETQGYLYSFSIFMVDFFSGNTIFMVDFFSGTAAYEHAKEAGWVLFAICFLYALWLSSRDFLSMLKGCFITMFTLLSFGTTFIQPWYFIWPFMFAILIPRLSVSLACFLLLYSATLAEFIQSYIFAWGSSQYSSIFVITNSIAYLTIFLPPALLLLASRFKPIHSQAPSS